MSVSQTTWILGPIVRARARILPAVPCFLVLVTRRHVLATSLVLALSPTVPTTPPRRSPPWFWRLLLRDSCTRRSGVPFQRLPYLDYFSNWTAPWTRSNDHHSHASSGLLHLRLDQQKCAIYSTLGSSSSARTSGRHGRDRYASPIMR